MKVHKSYGGEHFLYGVCYFPEHWEQSMWDDDFRRIKEMGMNVVRMGEGAWNVWEPEEGRYSFELFDQAIALCVKHDLKVILGTPTYTPPAWLTEKYPEVLRVNFEGDAMTHGSRRHYNYTSPVYVDLCRKIVTQMAEHYKDHPSVIGWQIDNEFNCHMDVSFAESDHVAFREWCQLKYGSLDELNRAWGTAFWAQTYTDWGQVYLPRPTATYHNPSLLLDFYRFTSDTVVDFARVQYDILKAAAPHQFITHNGLFSNLDNEKLTREALDFMSYDSYPAFALKRKDRPKHFRDRGMGLSLGRVRGHSEKFLILEQQAGPGGQVGGVLSGPEDYLLMTPKPGQMRLWAWQSIANGADGVLFFRWRTVPYGSETLWHGLNHYGNQPNWRLDEAKRLGEEIATVKELLLNSRVKATAAQLYDYDNESHWKIERFTAWEGWSSVESIYQALNERHVTVDQLSYQHLSETDELVRKYAVMFYSNAQLLNEEDVRLLRAYVEQGGTLVFGPRSGYKDRDNQAYMQAFPGVIKELAGVEITDFTMVDSDEPSMMSFTGEETEWPAPAFNEIVEPRQGNAEVLARYTKDYYAGKPAIVRVPVGQGAVVYCGAYFTPDNTSALLDRLGIVDPIAAWAEVPLEVEVVAREADGKELYFFFNYSASAMSVTFKETVSDCLSGRELMGAAEIEPYGVKLIARKP
ncbi:beta-galactosidase [Cohnella yongneupensis]|uniref:Beta-galactosidase n=1 Tax=Cohnella yongneupensis TaxID=425006 RepID=A0ABW0R857_9BACL